MLSLKSFFIGTTREIDLINIGHDVRGLIREAKLEAGTVLVTIKMPGAGVAIFSSEGKEISAVKKTLAESFPAPLRPLLPVSLQIPVEKGIVKSMLEFDRWFFSAASNHERSMP